MELPHPPLLTQKNPFENEKKNLTPCPFKAPLTTCNSFNLIELSTPMKEEKKQKTLTPLLSL